MNVVPTLVLWSALYMVCEGVKGEELAGLCAQGGAGLCAGVASVLFTFLGLVLLCQL